MSLGLAGKTKRLRRAHAKQTPPGKPGETESRMPSDFGDMTAYHREEAARHYALAQAARECGNLGEAEYQAGLAVRWDEVAREQKVEMLLEPARQTADQRPKHWPLEPQRRIPLTIVCLLALLRGVRRIAAAMRQFRHRRTAPIEGLSLR
jgi:hypothetical protein